MKVVFPTCCGVDVHKRFLVATVITTPTDSLQPSYQKKRFSTFNSDLNRFADWLHENECLDVCMESTGKYWVPVFNILEKRGIRVVIANPKWVKAVKGNADDILASVEGYEISPEQKLRIGIVWDHLHYIEKLIDRVDACINTMVEKYDGAISLLCTIPAIDRSSAITIISEVGVDMTQFGSSKRLCCWAGLTPSSNESAGKKKSVRISRAGVYLKSALVQVAHAAVKDKQNPYYALKYESIAKRRGKKRAIIAIARMILTAIYSMLSTGSTGEIWNPVDLFKVDMPEHLKEQQLQKAVKQAVRFLEAQGLRVS